MYSFIILHYKNISETIKCLEKLSRFKDKSHFIVVDNNTLLDNDEMLIQKYTSDVIKLKENLGFAKANNEGIKYAYKKYNSDYYIIINNDVEITQNDFLRIIDNDYKRFKFDMLGPWIDTPGYSVNPYIPLKTKDDVINEIKNTKRMISIYSSPLKTFFIKIAMFIKHIFIKKKLSKNGDRLVRNCALHGCTIIFSKKYIEKYDYPFYNETFLFHEEDFLYKRLIKDDLISIYDPDLKVYHSEGKSMTGSNREKRLFRELEKLKSLNMLLTYMEGL